MRAVQCPKCQAWCLLDVVDGFKTAVDVVPSTPDTYRATLIAGRHVYGLRNGKLRMLVGKSAEDWAWADRKNEHEHSPGAFRAMPVKAPAAGARLGVCDLRRQGGWIPPAGCPRAAQGLSAAGPKSCDQCEPPPFELELFKTMLGATVIEVIEH